MPIHPAMASKFHLLEGISSFQQFLEDPAVADRRKAFDEHPGYDAPAVATRMEETPGPRGRPGPGTCNGDAHGEATAFK